MELSECSPDHSESSSDGRKRFQILQALSLLHTTGNLQTVWDISGELSQKMNPASTKDAQVVTALLQTVFRY